MAIEWNRVTKFSQTAAIILFVAVFALGFYLGEIYKDGEEYVYYGAEPIEEYVAEHISEISPEKEVLGGKFYVTKIEAEGGSGIVHYEDGHNAFTADFIYEIDERGMPAVTSFIIKK